MPPFIPCSLPRDQRRPSRRRQSARLDASKTQDGWAAVANDGVHDAELSNGFVEAPLLSGHNRPQPATRVAKTAGPIPAVISTAPDLRKTETSQFPSLPFPDAVSMWIWVRISVRYLCGCLLTVSSAKDLIRRKESHSLEMSA